MLSNIKARNFLSWKNLDFSVKSGITLVDGWNEDDGTPEGCGKSAILNAVTWCAYGKFPKEVNIDDVIKDGESSCGVELEFDNGDSIVRSRKPNEFYLMKAGVVIKGKDARETQTIVEEYLGCNFETFCQSVYFAQNYEKKFLSSNQEEKGKILSSIQNLQVFDRGIKEANDLRKLEDANIIKLKNQLQIEENNFNNLASQGALVSSFIQDKIQKHQQQVYMMTQQRDLISGHIKRTESDAQMLRDQQSSIDLNALSQDEIELNQAKTQYTTQLSGVSYQKSQIDSIKKAVETKEKEGSTLAGKYSGLEQKIQVSRTAESPRIKSLMANRDYLFNLDNNTSRNRLLIKSKQLEDFISNPTKICPSCGTELASQDTTHVHVELELIRKEIIEIESGITEQTGRITLDIQNEKNNIVLQETAMIEEMQSILVQLQSVSEYLDQNKVPSADELAKQETEIKTVIKQIDDAMFQTQQKKLQYQTLTTQVDGLMGQLSSYAQQLSQYENTISQLGQPDVSQDQSKLQTIEIDLGNVQVHIGELKQLLDVSLKHSQKLETLKEWFKEIKSYVFNNALNELNFRTNKYLTELFEVEATIKFTNEEQKIESKITLAGQDRSLGLLSGGQNRRFNLAVDLALSDIVGYRKTSKLDLLIFDEYYKDLSEVSMSKALELLKTRKSPVILIEHNSVFKSVIENTFFVRLENGTSSESRQ